MVGKQYADLGGVPSEVREAMDDPSGGEVRRVGNVVGDDQRGGAPVCRCGGEGMVCAVSDKATGEYLGSDRFDVDPGRKVTEQWYPCPACRPEQFQRMTGGKCAERDHDRATCGACQTAAPIKGAKPRSAP